MNQRRYMSSFGERLKYFRKDILKMKQKTFCEKYDFSPSTIKSWENNGIKLSKRNAERLEHRLRESGVVFDSNWLFLGISNTNSIHQNGSTNNTRTHPDKLMGTVIYRIDSFCYEPLWKKNTELLLEPASLTDINCPSLGVAWDQQQNIHIGTIKQAWDKNFIMEAYLGSYYTIVLNQNYDVFLIKKLTIHT
jgi:hypothetical protein